MPSATIPQVIGFMIVPIPTSQDIASPPCPQQISALSLRLLVPSPFTSVTDASTTTTIGSITTIVQLRMFLATVMPMAFIKSVLILVVSIPLAIGSAAVPTTFGAIAILPAFTTNVVTILLALLIPEIIALTVTPALPAIVCFPAAATRGRSALPLVATTTLDIG